MTTPYAERFDLVENGLFRKRLQYALWVAARDVLNDASSTTQQKTRARELLRGVLEGDTMRRLAIACVANPTIGDAGLSATDADIQFVVNGVVAEL